MTRTDLCVLLTRNAFPVDEWHGVKAFEDNVVWKLQVRTFLPVFGSVFLLVQFGTQQFCGIFKNWRSSHQAAIYIY